MVHVPVPGKPLNITLPVETAQLGCVIVPIVGAAGVTGCTLIITFADADEIHPTELVTVKLYVPVISPDKVVLEVDPAMPPGLIIQLPEGSPLKTTLPVATTQVG
jgi:hypothetical protein